MSRLVFGLLLIGWELSNLFYLICYIERSTSCNNQLDSKNKTLLPLFCKTVKKKGHFIFFKSVTLIVVFYFAEKPISIRERFISTLDGINANTWSILQTSATKSRWWDWCVHEGMFNVILPKGGIVARTLQMQIHWKLVVLSIHPSEWLLCSRTSSRQIRRLYVSYFPHERAVQGEIDLRYWQCRNRAQRSLFKKNWADIFTASITCNSINRRRSIYQTSNTAARLSGQTLFSSSCITLTLQM